MLFPSLKCDAKPAMVTKTKIKLRTCEVCGIKKKVTEFSIGKICNKCEIPTASTLQESSTDDETIPPRRLDETIPSQKLDEVISSQKSEDLQSLHTKMDHLHQRFDKLEMMVLGLMELVGKINYDMEMNKVER